MSKTKRFLKLTAFAAAVMMAAGMSLTVCPGTLTPLTVSADAEYADEPSTFGSNGTFNYQKFSDHIFITGATGSGKLHGLCLEIKAHIHNFTVKYIRMLDLLIDSNRREMMEDLPMY